MGSLLFIIFVIIICLYFRKVPPGKVAVIRRSGNYFTHKPNETYFFNPSKDSVTFVDISKKQFWERVQVKTKDDYHYTISVKFDYYVTEPIKYVESKRYLENINVEATLAIKKFFLLKTSKELIRNPNHSIKLLDALNNSFSDYGYSIKNLTTSIASSSNTSDNCTVTKYEKVPCIHTDDYNSDENESLENEFSVTYMTGSAIKNYDLSSLRNNPIKESITFKNIGIDSLDSLESNVDPIKNQRLKDIQDANVDPIENY